MKTIFLTSSPFGPLDNSRTVEGFDPMNCLTDNLSRFWKKSARCLVISAFPADIPACIKMRESMQKYGGLVIGISAGTMNAAEVVYAQPELEGEAVDPEYRRFINGLGLTKINILPHYQMTKNFMLDGMRLFEDITYGDSCGRRFLVLPDGSYFTSIEGQGTVWGEAYEISDGQIRLICADGEHCSYSSDGIAP